MGARGPKARPVAERFAAKVAVSASGCHEWQGGTNGCGYGVVHLGPEDGNRKVYAHRWAYQRRHGQIADGLHLDHLCRNPICVNPDHLEPVTPGENVRRGVGFAGVNSRKTHCPYGHPYDEANTYTNPNTGSRVCLICRRERDRLRPRRS